MSNYYIPRHADYMKSDYINMILAEKDGFKLWAFYECLLCHSIPTNGIITYAKDNANILMTPRIISILLNRFNEDPEWVTDAIVRLERLDVIKMSEDLKTITLLKFISRPIMTEVKPDEEAKESHHRLTSYLIQLKYVKPNYKKLDEMDSFFEAETPIEGIPMGKLEYLLENFVKTVEKENKKIKCRFSYMKTAFFKAIDDVKNAESKKKLEREVSKFEEIF